MRYRGWRFSLESGLEVAGAPAMVEDDDDVRQSLLLLIATRPGERVMRPQYGCELHRVLFSPNDQTTAGLAIHYVRRAVERWEPRVEVLRVDAGARQEDATWLDVTLEYRVLATRRSGRLVVPVSLYDEVTA